MNDYGKKKFRNFAKANRLRLKRSEDGLPIVVARGKQYEVWHLYEGFGTNALVFTSHEIRPVN